MEVNEIFCTIIDITKMFVMSLDFADVINNENMFKEMKGRIKPFNFYIWFISDETIWYQNKSLRWYLV